MRAAVRDIFVNDPLRIGYLSGYGETLVVSCSGVGDARSAPPEPEFVQIASDGGRNHCLFVRDLERSWLNAPDMAEQIIKVVEETKRKHGLTRVVALGNSMGGTMALLLSVMMPMEAVVAIVPQYSVDPRIVPEERRWRYFRKRITRFRFAHVDGLRPERTCYTILHGGGTKDAPHLTRFEEQEGVVQLVFPGHGHRLAQKLKAEGALDGLVRDSLNGALDSVWKKADALGALPSAAYLASWFGPPELGHMRVSVQSVPR